MRQQSNNRHDRKSLFTITMPMHCYRFACWCTLLIIISLIFITQQQLDKVCIDAFSVNTNNVNPKSTSSLSSSSSLSTKRTTFLIIGGTGKVGSAVAKHLLQRQPNAHIILSGRRPLNEHQMNKVLQEIQQDPQIINNNESDTTCIIEYVCQDFDQTIHTTTTSPNTVNTSDWVHIFQGVDCIIHTAGPYINCIPRVLEVAIQTQVPVYIDVSDPLPYLEHGISCNHHTALQLNTTTAILAAGAYPGMSNVLGIETAKELMKITQQETIQDIRYNFFAAGLGGIGLVNLYITNIGFGDPIGLYENGRLHLYTALSGMILGTVDFFFPSSNVRTSSTTLTEKGYENDAVKTRVGTKQVFAWPFPEGATVPTQLRARGSSSVAMGVAPDLWNTILGLLVAIVPRTWWRNHRFSQFMADFSQPLVILTDKYMKWSDPNKVGETHCMRIDVTSCVNRGQQQQQRTMSTIQAHESLRTCVGQSCAEFALDCLEHPQPGVYYPEQRYEDDISRKRIIEKLTSTDGTFCFISPIETTSDDSMKSTQPSNIHDAMRTAKMMEELR